MGSNDQLTPAQWLAIKKSIDALTEALTANSTILKENILNSKRHNKAILESLNEIKSIGEPWAKPSSTE